MQGFIQDITKTLRSLKRVRILNLFTGKIDLVVLDGKE